MVSSSAYVFYILLQGCDGSILLGNSNGITAEILSDKNFGIRKVGVINEIKSSLETICPGTVSCADIIQLAARDAVYLVSYIGFLKNKEILKKILKADLCFLHAQENFCVSNFQSGGPYIEVLTGRRDAVSAKKERADNQLPTADISVNEFIEIFLQKNISLEDGVALIGTQLVLKVQFTFLLYAHNVCIF